MIDLYSKIEYFIFFMSALNLVNHLWKIINELRQENPKKILYTKREIFFIGLSISYILTKIFI